MKSLKPVIYLDFDGVLANFEGKAFELFGNSWKTEIDKPGWGMFAEYPNLYEILVPYHDAKKLYQGCCTIIGDKNQVRGLTALPKRARDNFRGAAKDKIDWAFKHIDPNFRTYFGPLAQDKQYHAKHPHDVLIDDMKMNIDQWNAAGSFGILHTSVNDTLDKLSDFYSRLK